MPYPDDKPNLTDDTRCLLGLMTVAFTVHR